MNKTVLIANPAFDSSKDTFPSRAPSIPSSDAAANFAHFFHSFLMNWLLMFVNVVLLRLKKAMLD